MRNVKEIMQEKADLRELKEKRVDCSLSYPTYGRGGLEPNPDLDTFMINEHLCHDVNDSKKKSQDDSQSPKKSKRPKVISPKRQQYET